MTRFQIRPKDQPQWAEIFTTDAAHVLPVVQRSECKDADVFRNGAYAYSVRLGANGIWCIYQREKLGRERACPNVPGPDTSRPA